MSALILRKLPPASMYSNSCMTEGCNRKGRWALAIAGYPVISDLPLTRGDVDVLCGRCGPRFARTWADLNGETFEQQTVERLTTLKESSDRPKDRKLRTARADAIDALRLAGFSAEQVGWARALVEQGIEPEAVFEDLVWGEMAVELAVVA